MTKSSWPSNLPVDNQQLVGAALGLIILVVAAVLLRPKPKPALNATEWQKYKLIDKVVVSPNTAIYRFAIPGNRVLGLPIGQHISVSATIDGKLQQRSYTPTSSDDDKGFFDLMVKSYPTGNISKHFAGLKVGDFLDIKGPKGQMKYTPDLANEIGMIAGGTGITPMLQIIRAALKNPLDRTKLSLVYANVKPEDILLKSELDRLAKAHPDRFSVYYVLNEPPAQWDGGKGFVTTEIIKERLPAPKADSKILLCGPPPMIKAMKTSLEELKFEPPRTISKLPDQVFCF